MDSIAPAGNKEHYVGLAIGIAAVAVVVYLMTGAKSGATGSGYQVIGPSAAEVSSANANAAADYQAGLAANNQHFSLATNMFSNYIAANDALSLGLAQTQAGVAVNKQNADSALAIAQATDAAQV